MDAPVFDHLARIEAQMDRDVAHLDWSSLPPADPADLAVDGPGLSPDDPGDVDALRARLAERHDVPPDRVLVTLGATEAVHLAIQSAVDAGETVLVESPTYQPLRDLPTLAGADVERFERSAEDGFRIPVDDVLAGVEAGARLVVLANLHNPTGVGLADDDLAAVAEATRDLGAWVLVDEVYRRSALGRTAGPASRFEGGIVADSLTKFFGYGNLRTGWLVGPPGLVARARRRKKMQNPGRVGPGTTVAAWCLEHEAELTRHAKARLDRNRALVETWVGTHDVDWVPPDGGNVCAPRVGGDDVAFADRALEAGVAVVPGSAFELPGHVRIAFGIETPMLEDGLKGLSGLV